MRPRTRGVGEVEIAAVMRAPNGEFIHRRIVCSSTDTARGLPYLLFDPDPDPGLLRARAPSKVRKLRDRTFDTFDEALEAAHAEDPAADPDAWLDQDEFRRQTEKPPPPRRAKARAVGLNSSPNRPEPTTAEVNEVAQLVAHEHHAGRVLGARPGEGTTCEVELVIVSRVYDGSYQLRSAVVGLGQLREVKDELYLDLRPTTFTAEDLTFPTLRDAVQSAHTVALASRAEPVPGLAEWAGGEKFLDGLKRSELRSQIPWLPQPPRWWLLTRRVLTGVAVVLIPCVAFIGPLWALIYLDVDPDSWREMAIWVLFFAAAGVLLLFGWWADGLLDRVEPRLERYRDATNQPSRPPPTAPAATATHLGRPNDPPASGAETPRNDIEDPYTAVAEGMDHRQDS